MIQSVATHINKIVDQENPIISAELPESESRFEGLIPPVVKNPIFTIRKKGIKIFTLDDYVEKKTLTVNQKEIITQAVKDKLNILIVGPVSSGKTTFANAVGDEIQKMKEFL